MTKGSKVTYKPIQGADVLGTVVATGRDIFGSWVRVKVTSQRHASYPRGYELITAPMWLTVR